MEYSYQPETERSRDYRNTNQCEYRAIVENYYFADSQRARTVSPRGASSNINWNTIYLYYLLERFIKSIEPLSKYKLLWTCIIVPNELCVPDNLAKQISQKVKITINFYFFPWTLSLFSLIVQLLSWDLPIEPPLWSSRNQHQWNEIRFIYFLSINWIYFVEY